MYVKFPKVMNNVLNISTIPNAKTSQTSAISFLRPKVTSYQKTTDRNGNTDFFLNLQFFCQVHAPNYLKSKESQQHLSADYIEMRLSRHGMNYYERKASETPADAIKKRSRASSIKNSKNGKNKKNSASGRSLLKPHQSLAVGDISDHFEVNKKAFLYEDTLLIGRVNLASAITDKNLVKKELFVEKIEDKKLMQSLETEAKLSSRSFQKIYTSMIEMNDDQQY